MKINVKELKPLRELAGLIPPRRKGRPLHPSTLHRWRVVGSRGNRLFCVRVGGIWCSSEKAIVDFIAAASCLTAEIESDDSSVAGAQLAEEGW
jgi:hypothetical protein